MYSNPCTQNGTGMGVLLQHGALIQVLRHQHRTLPPYPERLSRLGLEFLEVRRRKIDLLLFFKISHGYTCLDKDIMTPLSEMSRIRGYYLPKISFRDSALRVQLFLSSCPYCLSSFTFACTLFKVSCCLSTGSRSIRSQMLRSSSIWSQMYLPLSIMMLGNLFSF